MPERLSRRVLSDGLAVQAGLRPPRRAGWRDWVDLLGGWPALGGMATACAVGLWIGLAPPTGLPDPVELVQTSEAGLFAEDDLILALAEEN